MKPSQHFSSYLFEQLYKQYKIQSIKERNFIITEHGRFFTKQGIEFINFIEFLNFKKDKLVFVEILQRHPIIISPSLRNPDEIALFMATKATPTIGNGFQNRLLSDSELISGVKGKQHLSPPFYLDNTSAYTFLDSGLIVPNQNYETYSLRYEKSFFKIFKEFTESKKELLPIRSSNVTIETEIKSNSISKLDSRMDDTLSPVSNLTSHKLKKVYHFSEKNLNTNVDLLVLDMETVYFLFFDFIKKIINLLGSFLFTSAVYFNTFQEVLKIININMQFSFTQFLQDLLLHLECNALLYQETVLNILEYLIHNGW